jgi:hypothetical protein
MARMFCETSKVVLDIGFAQFLKESRKIWMSVLRNPKKIPFSTTQYTEEKSDGFHFAWILDATAAI